MTKETITFGIYLIAIRLVMILCNEKVVYTCQDDGILSAIDKLGDMLRNFMTNVSDLTIICKTTDKLSIDSNLFPHNMTLKSLNFYYVNLEIMPNAFSNLINVRSIVFKKCRLLYIHIGAFGRLEQLNLLDLSNNNISVFNSLWIPQSSHIHYLNLSHNKLTYFSQNMHISLKDSVDIFNVSGNEFACHCVNLWMDSEKSGQFTDDARLCPPLTNCNEQFSRLTPVNVTVYTFTDVTIECPIVTTSLLPTVFHWISPHNDVYITGSHVRISLQPMFIDTTVIVNGSSITIGYFRGYFAGTWICMAVSQSGLSVRNTIVIHAQVKLKQIFDFSIFVGFTFAGCWLLVAIVVGLVQYCRETSCCRHRLNYNKSSLFERRYAKTVIPVPMEDSVSDSGSNDEETTSSQPLGRVRHESHNNDVQLIFTDENLADQYAQMLSDLKDASEIDDENFYNRLRDMRLRFSIDFSKMRFDMKRGMEQLRSNSSAAAHKLRKSVVHMKDHMKSFTEFCGTASIAQSISIVVIPDNTSHTDAEGREDRPHRRTVINFFEPC